MPDARELQPQLTELQTRLQDIAAVMRFALAHHDTAKWEAARAQFKELAAQAAALRTALNAADAPSSVLVTMDKFGDAVIAVGREVGEDVSLVVKGAAGVLKNLPLILGLTVAALGLGYAIYRAVTSPKRSGR